MFCKLCAAGLNSYSLNELSVSCVNLTRLRHNADFRPAGHSHTSVYEISSHDAALVILFLCYTDLKKHVLLSVVPCANGFNSTGNQSFCS